MSIKTINTRLLVSVVSNLKKQEIENCLIKIDKLNKLLLVFPDQKTYSSHLKIVNARLKMLIQTSRELGSLERDINNLF